MKKIILAIGAAALAVALILTAQATEYTNLVVGGNTAFAARDAGQVYTLTADIDFADQNVTTNDVVQAIRFPADCRVTAVQIETTSLATTNTDTTQTLTVGDGSDTDGWITSLSLLSATSANSAPSITTALTNNPHAFGISTASAAYSLGKHYTAADTIDLKVAGVLTDGTVRVRATIWDYNR